ncbi:hypothetical protein ACP70R_008635 [Stipagrostis hirtigluma subsp. patula]
MESLPPPSKDHSVAIAAFSIILMTTMVVLAARPGLRHRRDRLGSKQLKSRGNRNEQEVYRHGHNRPEVIMDSAATNHVTSDRVLSSMFRIGAPDGSGAAVYHAPDGRALPVASAGTIDCESFQLSGVLYVPELGTGITMVSVQQLAGRGYLVMFGGGQCYVKDRSSGSLVGKGRFHDDDGLYHLEFLRIPAAATAVAGAGSTAA